MGRGGDHGYGLTKLVVERVLVRREAVQHPPCSWVGFVLLNFCRSARAKGNLDACYVEPLYRNVQWFRGGLVRSDVNPPCSYQGRV